VFTASAARRCRVAALNSHAHDDKAGNEAAGMKLLCLEKPRPLSREPQTMSRHTAGLCSAIFVAGASLRARLCDCSMFYEEKASHGNGKNDSRLRSEGWNVDECW
jgi:hypothetical protein